MNSKAIRKQLLAAVAMVLVAAVALGSSTYAWFAANSNVTAEGMSVNAQAENGLIIANSDGSTWGSTAQATVGSATLYPISTKDTTTWYHAVSTAQDNAQASQDASKYTQPITGVSNGVGYQETGNDSVYSYDDGDLGYYLLNTFKIKSSAADMSGVKLYVNKVTITDSDSTVSSGSLNKSLRVAVVLSGDKTENVQNVYIFAPTSDSTTTYKVGGNDKADYTCKVAATDLNTETAITSVSASNPITASVYVYYEGEDAACKSTNIVGITPDTLNVSVQFGTATITPPEST